ncbi:hypothetical protein INT43_001112 [Umbelopsis isabellina]|uniref:Myb-like domain-containing protein n=1 Tax=Mortierella isabellina TaxID=91625 RepID=A0A8H7PKM3_MORIS|nr:hypothetical protein INT43_001112 [Umbelopsis isabellina]
MYQTTLRQSGPPNNIRHRVQSLPSFSDFVNGQQPWDNSHFMNRSPLTRYGSIWDQDERELSAAASLLDLQTMGQSDSEYHSSSSSQDARMLSPAPTASLESNSNALNGVELNAKKQMADRTAIRKRLRPSRSTPLPSNTMLRTSHDHEKKKPRWNNKERCNLFMAVIKDRDLDDMSTYNWDKIASKVGRARKACKDQWRREVLPALIHGLKTDVFK